MFAVSLVIGLLINNNNNNNKIIITSIFLSSFICIYYIKFKTIDTESQKTEYECNVIIIIVTILNIIYY